MRKTAALPAVPARSPSRDAGLAAALGVRYGDTDMIAYMKFGCNITAAARSISLLGAKYE